MVYSIGIVRSSRAYLLWDYAILVGLFPGAGKWLHESGRGLYNWHTQFTRAHLVPSEAGGVVLACPWSIALFSGCPIAIVMVAIFFDNTAPRIFTVLLV
jgi:hypothetical protein